MRRIIARLAIVVVALCSIVLISFPSFPSTLGIAFKPQSIDRALKGDRLTNAPAPAPTKNGPKLQPSLERASKQVPLGCDRAFSSMSSPQFSTLFGRCLT
jgi:hypothetical protein